MEKYELWKRMEEMRREGQDEVRIEENGAEITIHMENAIWYPEYY